MVENDARFLIRYSEKYSDEEFEYRHVTLPESIGKKVRRIEKNE